MVVVAILCELCIEAIDEEDTLLTGFSELLVDNKDGGTWCHRVSRSLSRREKTPRIHR